MRNFHQRGAVLVMAIFFFIMFFVYFEFIVYASQGVVRAAKLNSKAESFLVSLLRLKTQIWETIPSRWEEFGSKIFVNDSNQLACREVDKDFILHKGKELKSGVPAYKARLTSYRSLLEKIFVVSALSNFSTDSKISQLELTPVDGVLFGPVGENMNVPGLWYKRLWKTFEINPASGSEHSVFMEENYEFFSMLGSWKYPLYSQFIGNITSKNSNQETFNGGFPAKEEDLIIKDRLIPFRYPYFSVEYHRGSKK